MPRVKQFPYTPVLGWSSSRYDIFSLCKRRYFYQYYSKYDQDIPIRRISQFRELVNIPLETGSIVHDVVSTLLKRLQANPEQIDENKFLDFVRLTTIRRLQTAKFEEVVYGSLAQVGEDDLSPKIFQCIKNMLGSDRFGWLIGDAHQFSSEWIIDPDGYGESRLGDLKIYCKVDFFFPMQEEYHIVDWKTGRLEPGKHRRQLVGYSTWASYHFEIEPTNVKPTIAYLYPDYSEIDETISSFDLENFGIQVRAETLEMYEYCRDISQNVPLQKLEFPTADDERICGWCNFRGLCDPERFPARL